MKKPNEKEKPNFHIKSFMFELGLSPNEVLVYALIYSFTKGAIGVYYGAREYIANAVGISARTVTRIYKKLYGLGLLEKYESPDGKIKGICARLPVKKSEAAYPCCEKGKNYAFPLPPSPQKTIRDIEEDLPRFTEKFAPLEIHKCDCVLITAEQYKALRRLVPNDVLYSYLRRFDRYLMNRTSPSPRSHYQVIKRWIEEDLSP